jgi:hypothetical protein
MRSAQLYCLFLLLLLILLPVNGADGSWLVLAEHGVGWDDNYLRLSDSDQKRFDRDADFQSDAASIGSWRHESRIYLNHYRRFTKTWRIALSGNYRFNQYPDNELNNYQAGMLSAEVRYGRQDRLKLEWNHLHDFYLRDFHHPFRAWDSPARFNGNTLYLSWRTTRLPFVTLTPGVGIMYEQYAEPFTAYDLADNFFGLNLASEYAGVTGQLRYQLHLRDNVGFDQNSGGYQTSLDSEGGDATSREHDWRIQFSHAPDRPWLKDITLYWRTRHRVYLTDSNGLQDPVHAGRIDRRQYLFCELEFPLLAGFTLEAGWQREWRQTVADWPDLSDSKDYDNDRNWVNLKYRWYRK